MNVTEQDYRIWKNKNFVIESTIAVKLWDEIIINDFHQKLNKILDEIYEKIDLFSNNLKILISISFSGDKKIMQLNSYFRKIKSGISSIILKVL